MPERVEGAVGARRVHGLQVRERVHVGFVALAVRAEGREAAAHDRRGGVDALRRCVSQLQHRRIAGRIGARLPEGDVRLVPDLVGMDAEGGVAADRRPDEAGVVGEVGRRVGRRRAGRSRPGRRVENRGEHLDPAGVRAVDDVVEGRPVVGRRAGVLDDVPVDVEPDPAGVGGLHAVEIERELPGAQVVDVAARSHAEPCRRGRLSRCRLRRSPHERRLRARRGRRAAGIAGGDRDPDRAVDVGRREHVARRGGAGDRRAAGARSVAAAPGIRVRGGRARPAAGGARQRLTDLCRTGDDRRSRVGRRGLGDGRRLGRRLGARRRSGSGGGRGRGSRGGGGDDALRRERGSRGGAFLFVAVTRMRSLKPTSPDWMV